MLKKYTLSFLKRWHLLFGTGFTVETIYGCKWLIDWTNSVDKNLSVKRHEDDQIVFMLDKIKELKPEIFIDRNNFFSINGVYSNSLFSSTLPLYLHIKI